MAYMLLVMLCGLAAEPRDFTTFQTGSPYSPAIDIASDVAIVYGSGPGFAERAAAWRERGYAVSLMTGISWGGYEAYYINGDSFKKDEVQTDARGRLRMHGDSKTVGYNVPTDAYIEFIKSYIEPAVDAGIGAIYLEEPEFWAETGWSEAFKRAWQEYYGEPWRAPDSSVDAQYRASRLKYELYYKALREVFAHAEARAAANGRTIECHVPTHSLINYAQWRIVSPESHLIDIPQLDGYIAQVWTGTARSANMYRGEKKERTFETAYLEYGQMLGMVRPTGKKVWFLADPVEDNPNRSWNDYRRNYECTVIASLLWPEVSRYEVLPWPDRIFQGSYAAVDMDLASDRRQGIPADYATELLTILNALNDMQQEDIQYDAGSRGIGIIVSDTLMFQRAQPTPSDPMLGHFYGMALPLVKHGVPVELVQLENTIYPPCLEPYKVLLLSYEGQKPLKPEYHDALAAWVKKGGRLLYVGDDSDPYHHVREWWNDNAANDKTPRMDLFARLGVTADAEAAPQPIGAGLVRVLQESPAHVQLRHDGADDIIRLVKDLYERGGETFKTQHYFRLHRGPFVIASVLDESVIAEPLILKGHYVDLFSPGLAIIEEKTLQPNERCLLYDLAWKPADRIVAASARVKRFQAENGAWRYTVRGPQGTRAVVRLQLPNIPNDPGVSFVVGANPPLPIEQQWDTHGHTLLMEFDNVAADVEVVVERKK